MNNKYIILDNDNYGEYEFNTSERHIIFDYNFFIDIEMPYFIREERFEIGSR